MPLVFAAVCPHSPLLHRRVGASHRRRLRATVAAYRELAGNLYAAKPEALLVITPHGDLTPTAFTIDAAAAFQAGLPSFGDFSPPRTWRADLELAQQLRAANESGRATVPLRFVHRDELDYGVVVPLALLAEHLPDLPVTPLHIAGLPPVQHWRFGQFLGDQLRALPRRVAVVASADLSHRLTAVAPAGFSPAGPAFDRQLLELLRRSDAAAVVNLPADQVAEAMPCGYLPIVLLLGVLDGLRWELQVLSYEGPFGIGHLVAQLNLA